MADQGARASAVRAAVQLRVEGACAQLGFIAYAATSYVFILQERNAAQLARDSARVAQASAEEQRDSAEARFKLGQTFARDIIFNVDAKLAEGVTAARGQLVTDANTYLEGMRKEAGDRPDLLEDIAEAYI